jgi:hypothetical protein
MADDKYFTHAPQSVSENSQRSRRAREFDPIVTSYRGAAQFPLASAFGKLLQFGCEIPAGSGGFFI